MQGLVLVHLRDYFVVRIVDDVAIVHAAGRWFDGVGPILWSSNFHAIWIIGRCSVCGGLAIHIHAVQSISWNCDCPALGTTICDQLLASLSHERLARVIGYASVKGSHSLIRHS